jgi:hypothetical protein
VFQGDRGPKGLKGLQGTGGFKVDCVVVRHEACGLFKSPRLPFGLPTQHMQIAESYIQCIIIMAPSVCSHFEK